MLIYQQLTFPIDKIIIARINKKQHFLLYHLKSIPIRSLFLPFIGN